MWKYNDADELYHYGVLGMKWGHRNSKNVQSAYKNYKQAGKELGKANRKKIFSKSNFLAGVQNNKQRELNAKNVKKAQKKFENSAFKLVDAAAKDSYKKTLSKTGSKEKATKASMKTHYKAFRQNQFDGGRVGSNADRHGGQKRFYNHMVKTQGKKYADAVEKRYNRSTVAALAAATVALGAGIYANYKLYKY